MNWTDRRTVTALFVTLLMVLSPALTAAFPVQAAPPSKIFHITLMVPQPNPARQAWSQIIQNNLQAIGIDASRVVLPWSTIYDRALTPSNSTVGKTYDQGGFDILFVGYGLTIDPDPYQLYHSSQFAPAGGNYYLWNNTQNDNITSTIDRTVDPVQRLNLVKQWQALAANELPSIPILYTKEIVAYDGSVPNGQYVFNTYHFPYWPPIEQLQSTTGTLILAQTGPAPDQGLIPELSTSYYDGTVYSAIFGSLAQRNDTCAACSKNMLPQLALNWTVGSDQKTWTVKLRPGVTWQDGQPLTADDVVFTYKSVMNDQLASPIEAFVKGIIGGPQNVVKVDSQTVQFNLPLPYAYMVQNILTLAILPQHVLSSVGLGSWKTSSFNTGQGGAGPVGTGPYKWGDYNSQTQTVHLVRNDNYLDFPVNGGPALQARHAFQVKDYYVRYIQGSDAAITALKNGEVNVLDSQYHLETQPGFLNSWGQDKLAIYDAFGVQEMGVNMEHPILGTGTGTPLGKQNATRAAESARDVRQAISYAVPRDQIISQLLNGYGNPAITTPIIGNSKAGTAVTQGFNTDLKPYAFDLNKARDLLRAAGYNVPAGPAGSGQGPTFFGLSGLALLAIPVVILVLIIAAIVALFGRRRYYRRRTTVVREPYGPGNPPP